MALLVAGSTTNFYVRYQDTDGPLALAVAQAVLAQCESDLAKLTALIPWKGTFAPVVDVQILNDAQGPGFGAGDNNGFIPGEQSRIRINPFSAPGVRITDDYAGFVFSAEAAELLMGSFGWDAGSSQGEALSRVMAETLHPASTAVWIDLWMRFPSPRPDYISQNAPHDGGVFGPGDLNQTAYGCGMVFIYFLHTQLGFTFPQIVGAGGALLSDRYRNLTGAADDPLTRVDTLLDNHYGTGAVNFPTNNPFPLYEGDQRQVTLSYAGVGATAIPLPQSGTAHVSPFVTCPAKDYPYTERGFAVTQSITANVIGIGWPTFSWKLNGRTLFAPGENGASVGASFNAPNPQDPNSSIPGTGSFQFDYTITRTFASSTLTITNRSFDGDYALTVEVDADESIKPQGPVSATGPVGAHTRGVIYGGTYDQDRQNCIKHFASIVSSRVRISDDLLLLIHSLPDPPPPYVGELIRNIEAVRNELARIAQHDPVFAAHAAQYFAAKSQLPAAVFSGAPQIA